MKGRGRRLCCSGRRTSGFALLITLALLALHVLAVMALSSVVRTDADGALAFRHQIQARRNALLALGQAMAQLQAAAGPDERITGMAGVAGIGAGAANATRHWCGVWRGSGEFLGWLASGAASGGTPAIDPALARVVLVDAGSVGAAATNSEHVEAGRLPIRIADTLTQRERVTGSYAYWVGDEGVKIGAYSPAAELAVPGFTPLLPGNPATSPAAKLRAALAAYAAKLPRIVAYEQLRLLPTPAGAALTAGVLQDSFHHVNLTARFLTADGTETGVRAGRFNLNTTSVIAWRGILESYNAFSVGPPLSASSLGTSPTTSLPGRIASNLAAAMGSGKVTEGPFLSVQSFADSDLLKTSLEASDSEVTPAELSAGLGTVLSVRSDTFRIRAYGDACNPVDQTSIEAKSWCEAIVQRTSEAAPNGLGKRFKITFFRWLTPEDI